MKTLFEPAVVGKLSLRNRCIRSATFEYAYDAATGAFADNLLRRYAPLAGNSVAAIVTGMVGVDAQSRAASVMISGYGATFVPELTNVAAGVHALGARLVVQIAHCGQKARQLDDGGLPLGPCDGENAQGQPVKGLDRYGIDAIVAAFAATAARCREAGADAVQIHAAHGYLLSEMLNPYWNRRTDAYGGPIAGRARMVLEVYDAVRSAVGGDYPVWIKINAEDLTEPSIAPDEFLWVCAELDRRGIDAIEVSGGASISPGTAAWPLIKTAADEGRFAQPALRVAETTAASVISVCGYRTPDIMEQWLNRGKIAALSLCRPLISEPDLVARWERGDRSKARCVSCSRCFNPDLRCVAFHDDRA